jgi:tetratricopeptide (TPR) repeat protein
MIRTQSQDSRFAMHTFVATFLAGLAILGVIASADEGSSARAGQVLDRFIADIKADKELPAEKVQKAEEIAGTLRGEPEGSAIAITEALCELYPEYRAALTALAEENVPVAVESLTRLKSQPNEYLQADAGYFLARAFLLDEQFEQTLPILETLLGSQADPSVRQGEALFLKGIAETQLLKHQEAVVSLERFLKEFPDAPERMRVGAFRQVETLKMFQEGTLSDVHLRMEFSRRRLALEDPGQDTRVQQDKIVEILAKLIKEAEERECSCRGGGSGSGQKKSQGKGSEGESQAQGEGSGQSGSSGGGSKGTDSDALKRLHRGGPQSPWSHLRDKERDPVFNAIKDKFPGRYQQLIEQYYKSFNDETEG